MAKYLISFPSAAMVVPDGEWTMATSIKGVLLVEGGVVLVKNPRNEWELPGGRIEPGESPETTLAREFEEELSVQVQVGASIDSYVFEVVPARHVRIVTYGCTLAGTFAPRISDEHSEYCVCPINELHSLNLPVGYRQSIERWKGGTMRTIGTAVLASIATVALAAVNVVNLDAPGALEALKRDRPAHYEKVVEAMDLAQAVPCSEKTVHDLLARPAGEATARGVETSLPAKTRLTVPVEDANYLITVVYVKNPAKSVPAK